MKSDSAKREPRNYCNLVSSWSG